MDFGPLWKKFVGLTAAAAALSAFVPAAPVLAEEPQAPALPSSLVNGDFELPSVSGIVNDEDEYDGKYIEWGGAFGSENFGTYYYNNSSFSLGPREEQWEYESDYDIDYHWNYPYMVTTTEIFNTVSENQFGWKTTASNDEAEIVNGVIGEGLLGNSSVTEDGMETYFGDNTTSDKSNAGRGDQFAELVANEKSSLYQSINTKSGNTYTWSLMHRGRVNNEEQVNTDSMAVFIGPQQTGLRKSDSSVNDIFMQMAELIVPNTGELDDGMMSRFGRTIYSMPVTDEMSVDKNSVSLYPTEEHTEKWTCWIITDDSKDWNTYQATYTVPEDQNETTIAFTAVSEAVGSPEQGVSDRGNCIDNVEFGELVPLTIETMAGGSGIVQYDKEAGENGEYKTEYDLTPAAQYYGVFAKGDKVVITAYENDGIPESETFLGALIDGEFKDRNQWTSDGNIIGANTYSYELTMDKRHEVLLLFSQTERISYDPNGGLWTLNSLPDLHGHGDYDDDHNPSTGLYEITLGDWFNYNTTINWTEDNSPSRDDGSTFQYWQMYIVGGEGVETASGHVTETHTLQLKTQGDDQVDIINDNGSIAASFSGDWIGYDTYYTVLMRAVYTNDITAHANTRSFGENSISVDDTTGGTVSVSSTSQYTTGKDGDNSMGIATGETFTVTAEPKPGYAVENWYYIDKDTNEMRLITQGLSNGNKTFTGSFGTDSDKDIYVTFSEVPVSPYLSAVPEDEDGFKDTGITAGIKNIDGYSGDLGGSEYGNTIATGYFVTREFDTNTTTIPSGVWTINIDEDNAFVKLADAVEGKTPIVTDSDGVSQENKGAIYKASDLGDRFKQQLKLYVKSGTTITGGEVTFGLIIDGLYAPHSQAGFKVTDSIPNDATNITDDSELMAKPQDGEPESAAEID